MQDYIIGFCLASAFAVGGFIHELTWRRHLAGSEIVTGKIVGESRGRNGLRPKVAYEFRGTKRYFVSKYGGRKILIGEELRVAYNSGSGKAEILISQNRWVWTVVPAGLSVIVIVGTLLKFQ